MSNTATDNYITRDERGYHVIIDGREAAWRLDYDQAKQIMEHRGQRRFVSQTHSDSGKPTYWFELVD